MHRRPKALTFRACRGGFRFANVARKGHRTAACDVSCAFCCFAFSFHRFRIIGTPSGKLKSGPFGVDLSEVLYFFEMWNGIGNHMFLGGDGVAEWVSWGRELIM